MLQKIQQYGDTHVAAKRNYLNEAEKKAKLPAIQSNKLELNSADRQHSICADIHSQCSLKQ